MTKEIGSQYKSQREALGLTQQQVADQLGISRTQLSRLENGVRNITDEMESKLDDIFSVNDSLKFEDLEVGDYVYIRDDLMSGEQYGNRIFLDDMVFGLDEITNITSDGTIYIMFDDSFGYTKEMINLSKSMKREDYLKMQEKEDKFDFIDLCLKANKAVDDGLLKKFVRHENCIEFFGPYIEAFSKEREKEAYDYIQSLYQEEFVIECVKDIERTKIGADIYLLNGNTITALFNNGCRIKSSYSADELSLVSLKGATVKQSKGTK